MILISTTLLYAYSPQGVKVKMHPENHFTVNCIIEGRSDWDWRDGLQRLLVKNTNKGEASF